jgi:hypothetical protein
VAGLTAPETPSVRDIFARRFPERSKQPVWSALRLALLQQCDQADEYFSHRPQNEEAVVQWAQKIERAFENIVELFGWLEPIQEPLTFEKVMAVSGSLSPETFKQFMKEATGTGRQRGRPTKVRDVAIRALELKSTLSWAQLTNRICPCGEREHGEQCRERIRISARQLSTILKRYEVQL